MRKWTTGFLKDEIITMASDVTFLNAFGFNSNQFKKLIEDYYLGKSDTDPHFVWYLYVLFKWYLRWIK